MPTTIDVLDALPGCNKSSAIFKHIANDISESPWLYLCQTKEEIDSKLENECIENNLHFQVPTTDLFLSKTTHILDLLKSGVNVICTHELMIRFTLEHNEQIKKFKYNIVCDGELNLISSSSMSIADYNFLTDNNVIEIDENSGKVTFTDNTMSYSAKYGSTKYLCDIGVLYSAKRSGRMMVIKSNSDTIKISNRFILLTFNYHGSIMESMLKIDSINSTKIKDIVLDKTNDEVKEELKTLLEFVETPTLKQIQKQSALSTSWWNSKSLVEKQYVFNAMASVAKNSKYTSSSIFFTMQKSSVIGDDYTVKSPNLSKSNFVSCYGNTLHTHKNKTLAIHAYSLFPNSAIKSYIDDMGVFCDSDVYALNILSGRV